jgi:hypothetical protein
MNVNEPVDADQLDADDLAAIAESDEQIRQGELLDWREVSRQLREDYGILTATRS